MVLVTKGEEKKMSQTHPPTPRSRKCLFTVGIMATTVGYMLVLLFVGVQATPVVEARRRDSIINNKRVGGQQRNHHRNSQARRVTRTGSFEVLEQVPHDGTAFTQGLQMANATHYYESLGLYGESAVRVVELATGNALLQNEMGRRFFGEGLCQYTTSSTTGAPEQQHRDLLLQITWRENMAFVYDADTLQEVTRIPYDATSNGEGWGITYDESKKVMYVTDGSANLHTWNVPTIIEGRAVEQVSERLSDRVQVYTTANDGSQSFVRNLNELEYDPSSSSSSAGTVLANVWQEDVIVRIEPETGFVPVVYDLSRLYPRNQRPASADVLNGIAVVPGSGSTGTNTPTEYWVTGKKWPVMFRVRLLDDDEDA